MTREALTARAESAILVDEVGIETGRYGSYLLKTAYRPVFRLGEDGLVPTGVEGVTQPLRDGRPVALEAFRAELPPGDGPFVAWMCRLLHLRNYANIGVEGLHLLLRPAPFGRVEVTPAQVDLMASCLTELEVEPALVVHEVDGGLEGTAAKALAESLRRHGMGVAVGDFSDGASTLARVRLLTPDVVRLDGAWFRRIAEVAVASRLLGTLVQALQADGAEVLIDGIDTAAQLRVALGTGAALLAGDFLHAPELAGTLMRTEPVAVETLLGAGQKVVPLFGNGDGSV